MGRGKPTHFATKQKRLEKRIGNSKKLTKAVNKKAADQKKRNKTVNSKHFDLHKRLTTKRTKNGKSTMGDDSDDDMGGGHAASSSSNSGLLFQNEANLQKHQAEFIEKMKQENEEQDRQENGNREAENTRRQFYRELRKVLAASDVIIQVLDVRDPESCRNKQIEREILSTRGKKMILLLNKVDLVPKEAALAWQEHLRAEFPTMLFKCGTRAGANNTAAKDASEGLMQSTSAVLGADQLIQLLKNYARDAGGGKKAISVGIVGYPNVGKSSVINSLKRSTVVKVGGTAGVTRNMQEIVLDSKVRLIDSPGIVFSTKDCDSGVILRNAVKIENLKDPIRVLEDLVNKIPLNFLKKHFAGDLEHLESIKVEKSAVKADKDDIDMMGDAGDNSKEAVRDFLLAIAVGRGFLKRKGIADMNRAAVHVLTEIACGKFRYHVMPSKRTDEELLGEAIVENKPTFHIDGLY